MSCLWKCLNGKHRTCIGEEGWKEDGVRMTDLLCALEVLHGGPWTRAEGAYWQGFIFIFIDGDGDFTKVR